MTRRQILLSCAVLAIGAMPRLSRAQEPHKPFTAWVQDFFKAQLAARRKEQGRATAEDEAAADLGLGFPVHEYLTTEMQALYADAQGRVMPPEEAAKAAEGSIFHELFGQGVLPGDAIGVVSVSEASWWQNLLTENLAVVTLRVEGAQRNLTLTGAYDAPTFNWEIVDIDYGNETLRERLEHMATWPKAS